MTPSRIGPTRPSTTLEQLPRSSGAHSIQAGRLGLCPLQARDKNHRVARAFSVVLLLAASTACSDPPSRAATSWEVYEGAWFTIRHPSDFVPRPSMESSTADGYDSVFFDAPEGEVTFYVHAPQWGGATPDIATDPDTEVMADSTSTVEGPVTTTRTTISARDGSWTRTYQTVYDDRGPSQWTVGWRYSSEAARVRHQADYDEFVASLEQFAN